MPSGPESASRALWRYAPAFLALPGLLLTPDAHRVLWVALLVAAAGLMIVRLDFPQAAWWASCGVGIILTGLRPNTFIVDELVPLLPFAEIGCAGRLSRTSAYLAGSIALVGVLTAAGAHPGALFSYSGIATIAVFGMPLALYGVAAAWSHGLGTRQLYGEMLLERAERLERDQERQSQLAVLTERSRIARDLHDVITHGVAVMVVQADAADAVWEANPTRSRQAVKDVADTGRTVMAELRAMLDAMREPEDRLEGAQRTATVGLEGAGDLVARLERAGIATELTMRGDLDGLAPAVSLAAERILRESLTNVLRHAGAQRVSVGVEISGGVVLLEVHDDGVGLAAGGEPGYGIRGMEERARLTGGELSVRTHPDGGTVMTATLGVSGSDLA